MRLFQFVVALAFFSITAGRLPAIAPPYIADGELARYPVIVVAKWEKAPFTAHHRREKRDGEDVITAVEAYTELKVERVIAGDLKPGAHKLMVGMGISWDVEGKWVSTGTSTELMGDASNITEPRIWFLEREKSWDQKDRTEYLSISNYRAIQPLHLERYFHALGSARPETEIPKLLASADADMVRRSLRYAAGGLWAWPYDGDFESEYQKIKKGAVLRDQAEAVAAVITRNDVKEVQHLAVAVYAELAGGKCQPLLRTLLTAETPEVRGTAAAILIKHWDGESLPGLLKALSGTEKATLACRIIEAVSEWGDLRLVPVLAAFLENDDFGGQIGDDIRIPALKTREVLHRMTGHWFPFDTAASLEAWKTAGSIIDFAKRQQSLAAILTDDPNPLKAEITSIRGTKAVCTITNRSKHDVALLQKPTSVDQKWSSGGSSGMSSGGGGGNAKPDRKDFVVLKPGESLECPLHFGEDFLRAGRTSRTLTLDFHSCGREWNLHAWMGTLTAEEK